MIKYVVTLQSITGKIREVTVLARNIHYALDQAYSLSGGGKPINVKKV